MPIDCHDCVMTEQRKRGRPVKRGKAADKWIQLRVDGERKEVYRATAGKRGLSDWAIDQLDKAVITSVIQG